jgi:hypothetical protein
VTSPSGDVGANDAPPQRVWLIVAVSVAVGLGLGALSYFGEGPRRPRAVVLLANLTSPWGIAAFLLGLWSRSLRWGAALGGAALVVGLAFFYTVTPPIYEHSLRDIVWTLTAVVVGPVMGFCGAAIRSPLLRLRMAGAVVAGAMFLAEAVWLALERRVWRYNLAAEPHRYIDLSVMIVLIGLAASVPLVLPRSTNRSPTYLAIAVLGLGGAAALAGLHSALVRV